ncbi:hypothetical protein [Sphingopyxis sp. H115]|nr:hypothetical protein [Sphingopyxis sp. H115]
MPDFIARHPDIDVDVRTSTAFERLDGNGYDLAKLVRVTVRCRTCARL